MANFISNGQRYTGLMDLYKRICYIAIFNFSLRYRILLLSVFLSGANVNSQDNLTYKPVFYSLSAYYGYFHVHTSKLSTYKGINPLGIELEISQLLLPDKVKNSFGFFPKWGLGINYVDFGHKDLGFSINGVAYFEPFIKINGKWRFSGKIGVGFTFLSDPYHTETNPNNKTYSTKFAFPIMGGVSAYHLINNNWSVKSTIAFRHISNGGIKEPNLGINYPIISIGAEYTSDKYKVVTIKDLDVYEQRKRQEFILGYSIKKDTISNKNRQVVMLIYNRSFRGGRMNAFTLSGFAEYQQIIDGSNSIDQWSIAPLIGNEFIIGSVRFGQQLGVYLLQRKEAPNLMLQQYYLRYLLGSYSTVGFNLKVHGRVADHLTLQIGYVF